MLRIQNIEAIFLSKGEQNPGNCNWQLNENSCKENTMKIISSGGLINKLCLVHGVADLMGCRAKPGRFR